MSNLLEALRRFGALRDREAGKDRVKRRVLDSVPPEYAKDQVTDCLGDGLRTALKKRGIESLYQHQAEAIARALEGENVVLQAPTAN